MDTRAKNSPSEEVSKMRFPRVEATFKRAIKLIADVIVFLLSVAFGAVVMILIQTVVK